MPLSDQPIAIVDVETTGSKSQSGRIIEIGVLRIENGQVVKSFGTLVNPLQQIPYNITQLTGITNQDVESAPTFEQVSQSLKDILEGCLFVAHNASFDYGFIKHEFKRLGDEFNAQTVCSVKLSRKLFPEHQRHNLGELIERYGLSTQARHRALDDAKAVWDFLQKLEQEVDQVKLKETYSLLTRRPVLPKNLNIASFDDIPEENGIYIFYDQENKPLYVGKANHLREKLMGYFEGLPAEGKRAQMMQKLRRVEFTVTAGDLSMKLLQQFLIKTLKPVYNFPVRYSKENLKSMRWPFKGSVVIEEKDVMEEKINAFFINDWAVLKAVTTVGDETETFFKADGVFDPATAKILYGYLKNNPYNVKEIR